MTPIYEALTFGWRMAWALGVFGAFMAGAIFLTILRVVLTALGNVINKFTESPK